MSFTINGFLRKLTFSSLYQRFFGGNMPVVPESLNLYQYKFIRYKEARDKIYPFKLSDISVPCKKDLVSIILPVYNGEDLVCEAIESILAQTYQNFELIIINDGSTDMTGKVIGSYENDPRITIINQENAKIPRTLSRGFKKSSGEFLTWTSADNVLEPEYIQKMVAELKSNPDTAMVYGNMVLIDDRGETLKNHGWYEYPKNSGNVILPSFTNELNTYPNNTIGAAFMYRASALYALGDYSQYKHTLEDYDYWMRMNSLFELKHTEFQEPLYEYRWHDRSLTAKDKELGITANRYKLMVLDDFRRDFYLTPLVWILEFDDKTRVQAEEFRKVIEGAGHLCISRDDLKKLEFADQAYNFVYINFCSDVAGLDLPFGTVKVFVSGEKCEKEKVSDNYDIYFTLGAISLLPKLDEYRGWFNVPDLSGLFGYLDAKIKNNLLYQIEADIDEDKKFNRKISAIVCTHRVGGTLENCLEALCNQTLDADNYEIILVNNDYNNPNIKSVFDNLRSKYENINLRYITAPVAGLSHARNAGMRASDGEILLYVDDDAIGDKNLLLAHVDAFEKHPEAGVIGGQILLKPHDEQIDVLTDKTRSLWSELVLDFEDFKFCKDYGEFPYGANFAVRSHAIKTIGGFKTAYGRVGNDFAGGEETLVCFQMGEIKQKVGLNPKAVVIHDIEISRYSREHIEKTVKQGILTHYRLRRDLYAPQDWSDGFIDEKIHKALRAADKADKESVDYICKKAEMEGFEEVSRLKAKDYESMKI